MPRVVDHSGNDNEDYNPPTKLETDLLLSIELSNVNIKMPSSRSTRTRYSSSPPSKSWPRLIAKTYNENAVGAFAGNFDKPISSNIRCGNTILNFGEFVNFRHEPKDDCHRYEVNLEEYKKLDDVSKLKSLNLADDEIEELNIAGPASIKGELGDLDKIIYTCVEHRCILPCTCYLCNDTDPNECDHKILHPGFFDPKIHLFTVRNADSFDINWNNDHLTNGNRFCTNRKCRGCVLTHRPPQRGFNYRLSCLVKDKLDCLCMDCPYCKSLDVLKYAGTEQSCESCKMKLLHHESYHLVYHYMCLFCRESLSKFRNIMSEKEYWEELDERRFEETISCQFCKRLFFDEQKKKRHIEIVHNKNPDYLYSCDECSKAFGSKQALRYHIANIHEEVNLEIPCGICEKTFRMDQNLDDHMREVHRDLEYDCGLCHAQFKRQSNLNHHYKISHDTLINTLFLDDDPDIIEYFECELCDHKTREKRTLVHHVKVVHLKDEQPVLSCDVCDFETIETKTLNHHKKTMHFMEKLEIFVCDLCEFNSFERKTLNRHKQTVHGKKQFACDKCNFKTKRKDTLDYHQSKIHSKDLLEKYHCDLCDFISNYKQSLNRHKKNAHEKKGKFECDQCEYKTNGKNTLNLHKRRVHVKKIFRCEECEFRTLDENLFFQHNDSIHLECDQCQFKTTLPKVLNSHKNNIHPKIQRKRKSDCEIFDH